MDGSKPGGIYGEASGRMEVTDKCSNAGKVMSIESRGDRGPLFWNGRMGPRTNREAP